MKAGMKLVLVLVIASIALLALATEVAGDCIPQGASCNRLSTIPRRCCFPMVCGWDSSTCVPATINVKP
uniref:U-reduvitoxin-Pr3a n=1 Tax=Platymeris rhadamanthus TaxID=1134088 RepID=PLK3A_PLARH|nr:RecName: Full=U-reduvitoxin-Pr3a; Short=U-RDTX-Pr3a; Flags: Precursor [Platymeris rhadamanthus]QHB21536.1 venom Ptu1 family peptide Pr3a [Platymeris rhadamanthus]